MLMKSQITSPNCSTKANSFIYAAVFVTVIYSQGVFCCRQFSILLTNQFISTAMLSPDVLENLRINKPGNWWCSSSLLGIGFVYYT